MLLHGYCGVLSEWTGTIRMTLRDFLKLTRRRLGTISACILLGAVAAGTLLVLLPTHYTSQATAYVRVSVAKSTNAQVDSNAYFNASQLAAQKVKAFVPLFTSETVAQAVITQLGLSTTPAELAADVSASNAANSLTIDVTAAGDSPEQSRQITDAIVNQSAAQVKRLEGSSSPVQVVMMAPADLSNVTKSPSPPKYLAAGILAGLLLGYTIAFVRQHFDTRLRTTDDITERFDIPILAVLPQSRTIARTEAASDDDFHSAESLRKLRTNLRYANVDKQARVILVTSPQQEDGKSSVAANLAKVMAMAGDDVILVDTDLRRPSVASTFDLRGPLGLLQLLVGSADIEKTLRPTRIDGLWALPAFDTPPNPSELLGSDRMAELIRRLSRDRTIILDAPPVLPVTDAVVLAHLADAVIMVASAGRTRVEQLDHALEAVVRGEGDVAGIVLNRAASSKLARIRYGDSEYGYSYSSGAETGHARTERPTPEARTDGDHLQESIEELSETRRMPAIRTADYVRDAASASHAASHRLRRAKPDDLTPDLTDH